MSNLIDQVKGKQKTIQRLQSEATKKLGRKEQLLKQLKADFEVSTRKEALVLQEEFKEVRKQNETTLENIDEELGEIIQSASGNKSSAQTPAGTTD